jgi:hypothetical protein
MGDSARTLALTVLTAAAVAIPTGPAHADIWPVCAGTTGTTVVCVDVNTGPIVYQDCVVVESPPCIPVVIRAVQVTHDHSDLWIDVMHPLICPIFAQMAPGHPPYLVIDNEGDSSGIFENDCPPYGV